MPISPHQQVPNLPMQGVGQWGACMGLCSAEMPTWERSAKAKLARLPAPQ